MRTSPICRFEQPEEEPGLFTSGSLEIWAGSSHLEMSELEQRKLLKRLDACLKRPENQLCADCPSRQPRWASVNLGIFICTNCSGIHRSLGVHISFVRSTTLDTWKEKQVVEMETMGNDRANAYWEASLPPGAKPTSSALPVVEKYIRAKYDRKMYADSSRDGPIRGDGSGGPVAPAPTAAPTPTPAAPPAGGGLFDLLDVAPATAPAATDGGWGAFGSAAPAAPATNGGWDAFGSTAPAPAAPAATGNWDAFGAPAPAPAPAAPAAAGGWDAFGAPAPAPAASAGPAANDGWDAFVSAPPAAAPAPQATTAAPAAADDWGAFTDAPAAAPPAAKPQVSNDDIMNLFSTPQGGGMGGMGGIPQQQVGGMGMGMQQPGMMQQPNMGMGMQQPNGMMGMQQPNGMMGMQQPNMGMQQPHGMMEMQQPNMGMQQPNMGIQQPHMGIQQPHGMMGMQQPNGMMGMQQPGMGMQQPGMLQQPNMGMGMKQPGGMMGMQQPSGMVGIHQPSGMMGTQMGNMPLDITPDTTYTPSEKKKPEPQHHAAFDQFKMF